MPSGISPQTVAGMARELGVSSAMYPLLTAWWNEIEQWERESCAEVAIDVGRRASKHFTASQTMRTANKIAAAIRERGG